MKITKEQKAANLARYEKVRKAMCEFRATHIAVCVDRLGTWADHNYPKVVRRPLDSEVSIVCCPYDCSGNPENAAKFAHIAPAVIDFLVKRGFVTRHRFNKFFDAVDVLLPGESFAE